jgi:hypothetical protein
VSWKWALGVGLRAFSCCIIQQQVLQSATVKLVEPMSLVIRDFVAVISQVLENSPKLLLRIASIRRCDLLLPHG